MIAGLHRGGVNRLRGTGGASSAAFVVDPLGVGLEEFSHLLHKWVFVALAAASAILGGTIGGWWAARGGGGKRRLVGDGLKLELDGRSGDLGQQLLDACNAIGSLAGGAAGLDRGTKGEN